MTNHDLADKEYEQLSDDFASDESATLDLNNGFMGDAVAREFSRLHSSTGSSD